MAISWKKTMLLGVLAAALVVVAAGASVTIYNPAKMLVDVLVDDKDVRVTTDVANLDITQAEQEIQFQPAEGQLMTVNVKDGDVVVLIPNPTGVGALAFKVDVQYTT